MKFKTRIIITFLTIILLPTALAVTAFLLIGTHMARNRQEYGFRSNDYGVLIDPTQASRDMFDEVFQEVKSKLQEDPAALENRNVLNNINRKISDRTSYIIVRRNDEMYYAGNQMAAAQIYDKLPGFDAGSIGSEMAQSIY